MFTVPTHWVLSTALYFDQFSARVLSAARSSSMQASLVRPTAMAYGAAELQLGSTSSFGGLSARAIAVESPSITATTAIILTEADIILSHVRAAFRRELWARNRPGAGRRLRIQN